MEDNFTYKKRFLSLDTIGFGAAQPPMVWGCHPQFYYYYFLFFTFFLTVNLLSVAVDFKSGENLGVLDAYPFNLMIKTVSFDPMLWTRRIKNLD